jgi:alpha-N-arabinofuranosidase
MAEWVEYITADGNTALAQLRRRNGRDKPWKLPYFGVGNETWGCGGNMRPEFFADLYRRFATFVKAPREVRPIKVASGANVDDYNWTEVLLSQAAPHMDAYSVHHYTFPGQWANKGPATGFKEDQWGSTFKNALRMEELVTRHSAIMDKYDPEKRIALYVDEWGAWYDPTPGREAAFLYQQNTIRDALVAALTLNVLHRHAERVRMANIAQMVNVLQAMILTDKERMVLTPTYHLFEMYIPFQGAAYVPVQVDAPEYVHGDVRLASVDASAARAVDGALLLALVNVDPKRGVSVSTRFQGANAQAAEGRVLTAPAMDSHNTFEAPDAVQPRSFKATRRGDALRFDLPPRSVTVVAVRE